MILNITKSHFGVSTDSNTSYGILAAILPILLLLVVILISCYNIVKPKPSAEKKCCFGSKFSVFMNAICIFIMTGVILRSNILLTSNTEDVNTAINIIKTDILKLDAEAQNISETVRTIYSDINKSSVVYNCSKNINNLMNFTFFAPTYSLQNDPWSENSVEILKINFDTIRSNILISEAFRSRTTYITCFVVVISYSSLIFSLISCNGMCVRFLFFTLITTFLGLSVNSSVAVQLTSILPVHFICSEEDLCSVDTLKLFVESHINPFGEDVDSLNRTLAATHEILHQIQNCEEYSTNPEEPNILKYSADLLSEADLTLDQLNSYDIQTDYEYVILKSKEYLTTVITVTFYLFCVSLVTAWIYIMMSCNCLHFFNVNLN